MHEEDFKALLDEGGIPTSESALSTRLQTIAEADEEFNVNNDSAYSPFWRVVKALAVTPANWLIQFMITSLLPNSFVKTATGAMLDILAWPFGLTRKAATFTRGEITFSRADSAGALDIPAGTWVQTGLINGIRYRVKTDALASFGDGQSTLRIAVTAEFANGDHNLGAGYYNQLPEPISGVAVTNEADWITTAGADQESDSDLALRCRNQFSALNQYHTDAVYKSLITIFAGIGLNNVFFNSDAPRGAGTANAYILLDSGQPAAQLLTDIQAYIMDDGNHGHGDDMQLFAMPSTNVDLTLDLWFKSNLTALQITQVTADAEAFVRSAFRENTLFNNTKTLPHSTFSFSTLDQEMHNQFAELASIVFNLSDITTALTVARLNSLTVNTP